jgi:predicted phosphodiesterase
MSNGHITWLHLSDLHFLHLINGETNRSRLEDSLIDRLKALDMTPDLIFVTGDIAFGEKENSRMSDQYRCATQFIEKILQTYEPNISKDRVFIVPGNHDINRTKISTADKSHLKNLDLYNAEKTYLRMEPELPSFISSANEYRKFLGNYGFQHLLEDDPKRLRYAKKINLNGVEVGIAGFNSAWSSFKNGQKGELFFCKNQIDWAREKLKGSHFKIALAHHPWNWLNEHEEGEIQNLIKEDFNFFLHGHEHCIDSEYDYERQFVKIDAGSTYQGGDRENTFCTMELPITGGDALMQGYVYKEQRGGVGFVRDLTPLAPEGKRILKNFSVNMLSGNRTIPPIREKEIREKEIREKEIREKEIREKERRREVFYWRSVKPHLEETINKIKQELGIKELSLVFLPERDGKSVAEIGEWERYAEVKNILSKQPLRKLKIKWIIHSCENNSLSLFEAHRRSSDLLFSSSYMKEINGTIKSLENDRDKWAYWVTSSPKELLMDWSHSKNGNFISKIKYLSSTENRNVAGFMVSPDQPNHEINTAVLEKFDSLYTNKLLHIIRHFRLDQFSHQLNEHSLTREDVLNSVLETAISLSGADWGCIKSTCPGAELSETLDKDPATNKEIVKAVCVHSCPRYFNEGRLVKTEQLVENLLKEAYASKQENLVDARELPQEIRDVMHHPAEQICIAIIRDKTGVIQPRIDKSNIVGVLVLQHTYQKYFEKNFGIIQPILQKLCDDISLKITSIAAKSILQIAERTISPIKKSNEENYNLINNIATTVDQVHKEKIAWILFCYKKDGTFEKWQASKNCKKNILELFLGILGFNCHDRHSQETLLGLVCSAKSTMYIQNITSRDIQLTLLRADMNRAQGEAYFQTEYERVKAKYEENKQDKLIVNLGDNHNLKSFEGKNNINGISITAGAIVAPTGMPIGALGVMSLRSVFSEKGINNFYDKLINSDLRSRMFAWTLIESKKKG